MDQDIDDAEESEDEEITQINIKTKRQRKDQQESEDEEMAGLDDSVTEEEDEEVKERLG